MMNATRRLVTSSAVIAFGGIAVAAICVDCGTDSAPAGPQDAGAGDSPMTIDAGSDGAIAPADASACATDAAKTSDWPGWRRLTDPCPVCSIDVPLDLSSAIADLTWLPCTNGMPDCLQLKTGWRNDALSYVLQDVHVARGANGQPTFLSAGISASNVFFDEAVWDFATGKALAVWRNDLGAQSAPCELFILPVMRSVALYVSHLDFAQALAFGDPATVFPKATFVPIPGNLQYEGSFSEQQVTSETTFAFDLQPIGRIARWRIGTSSWAATRPAGLGGIGFTRPLVEKDDVFARSPYGVDGWGREYVIDSAGGATPLRAVTGRHISSFATDGTTMFWVESFGASDPNTEPQPNVEVWAAPYTSDPGQLAASAKRLADISTASHLTLPLHAVAFGGLYATRLSTNLIVVVRATDGAWMQVSPGPGRDIGPPYYLTQSEIWTGVQTSGGAPDAVLVRIGLHDW